MRGTSSEACARTNSIVATSLSVLRRGWTGSVTRMRHSRSGVCMAYNRLKAPQAKGDIVHGAPAEIERCSRTMDSSMGREGSLFQAGSVRPKRSWTHWTSR